MAELRLLPARMYAALLENSNDCIAVLASDGRTVFQSPAVASQLGYQPDELIGRKHYGLIHPDDRPAARERFQAARDGVSPPAPVRVRCRHKDGTWRTLDLTTSRVIEDPHPPFIVLTARDVTSILETTAALEASEHRLDLALELGGMGVTDFDYRTGELILSTGFTRLMGYETPPPVTSLRWFLQHVHVDDRASLSAVFNALRAPATDEFETLFRLMRDGNMRWWFGRVRVLRDADHQPVRAVGLVSDITERRHLEEQVRQAQKMEAIGRLAGGIAHDFNNLLTVISGYADTLLRTVAPADPRFDDVVEIQRAAGRAAVLTRQLLAFSRNQMLRRGTLDANVVVRDIATMIGRLIGSAIELKLELTPRAATVLADRGQLEQVLINLAVNARDAMPRGGLLEIRTSVVEVTAAEASHLYPIKPGRYVRISVSDSGVGIPSDVQPRVFEPFFTTKEPGQGTGIGLSTVYGIVKQSGGGIFLTSEAGVGTTFDVYLPYSSSRARSAAPAQPVVTTESEPHASGSTVLLVENHDRVRDLACRILSRQGYRVLTAQSGRQALELARTSSGPIDILLTDVLMPDLSGPELARAVRSMRADTAVVFMSGHAGDVLGRCGLDQEHVVFLEKPFRPASLTRKVREALAARTSRD